MQTVPTQATALPSGQKHAAAQASSYPNHLLEPPSSFLGTQATFHATTAPHVPAPESAPLPKNIKELRIDVRLLTEEARDVLRDPMNARIDDLFACYFEVKLAGYGDEFHRTQKRSDAKGKKWQKNSRASLEVARRFWVDILNNCRVAEVNDAILEEALGLLENLPRLHGKKYPTGKGFRDLIDWADEQDILNEAKAEAESAEHVDLSKGEEEEIAAAVLIERIRAETFLKHGRAIGRMGRFLEGLGLVPRNQRDKG